MTAEKQALVPDFVDVLFGGFLGALLASLVPLLGEAWWRRAKRLECMPVLDRVYELRETLEPPNPMAVHQETQEYMPGAAQAVKFGFMDCRVTEAMGHRAYNHLTADGQRAWRIHNRGTNRTSGLSVEGVGGNGRADVERIFFRAMTELMPSTTSLPLTADILRQAAADLVAGSEAEHAVRQALVAVGLPQG